MTVPDSIAEQHPEVAQGVADYSGGLLDQVTFSHGEWITTRLGLYDQVRWDSGWVTGGRLTGAAFQTAMGVGSTGIAGANTYGWWGSTGETCLIQGFSTQCGWSAFSSAVGLHAGIGEWFKAPFITHFYNGMSNLMSVWGGPNGC